MRAKTRIAIAALTAVALLGGLSTAALRQEPQASDAPATALAKARLELARKLYETHVTAPLRDARMADPETVALWSRRIMEAQYDSSTDLGDRRAAHREHVDRLKKWEKALEPLVRANQTSSSDLDLIRFHRLDAEFRLARPRTE